MLAVVGGLRILSPSACTKEWAMNSSNYSGKYSSPCHREREKKRVWKIVENFPLVPVKGRAAAAGAVHKVSSARGRDSELSI